MTARSIGYLLILAIPALLLFGWAWYTDPAGDEIVEVGPDLIVIERTDVFRYMERPAVAFMHETHVEKLVDEGCTACHENDEDGHVVPEFARDIDRPRKLMDFYHQECLGCHAERSADGLDTGPLTCGGCHEIGTSYVSTRKPAGLDLTKHQLHVKAYDDKCEECHHEYDEKTDALVYVEGNESSCRDCHEDVTEGKLLSMRDVAHGSCVACHREREEQKKEAGPAVCSGCHEDGLPDPLTPQIDVERLDRGQPDMTTITVGYAPFLDVEFDHLKHENLAMSCRVCHHQKLDKCSSCHTHVGDPKGDMVQLDDAFHTWKSERSCVGCHLENAQRDTNCSGCHGDGVLAHGQTDGSCDACHTGEPAMLASMRGAEGDAMEMALPLAGLLGAPAADAPSLDGDVHWPPPAPPPTDLEDVVEIGSLADKYQPVQFEHADHIEKLMESGEQLPLAGPFHSGSAFTCIACHHESEVTEENESCTSCHVEQEGPRDLDEPVGAVAAYHRQCVGCHVRMDARTEEGDHTIECIDCHAEAAGGEGSK